MLAYFGIDMVAIVAALGLTGFAISLAAKDTITNIISGLVIVFDSPFSTSDRIEVPAPGTWPNVTEVGIRSTKVVTRDNRLQTCLGIGTGVNVPWVKGILENAVRNIEGVIPDKPAGVLFTGFGDSSNSFRVRWWVANYGEKRCVMDRVCAAIQAAADEHRLDMPIPAYSLDTTVKVVFVDLDRLRPAVGELKES
jgi:small-conductance mechanosensitive channel